MIKRISSKEERLNRKILEILEPYPRTLHLAEVILEDEEARVIQEYANIVSIKRLGFNDHGPVHMRQVTYGALQIMELLRTVGIHTSLQEEGAGSYEDSLCDVVLAGFLHDAGMTF